MIAGLGSVLTLAGSKAVQWAAAAVALLGAVLGFALFERKAGAQGVEIDELKREVGDAHTVAATSARTARETDAQVLADLLKNARK